MITFNPFTGNFDFVGDSGSEPDGTIDNPFTQLNIKIVKAGKVYKIKDDLESVVTRKQIVIGKLIIDGVNTIL